MNRIKIMLLGLLITGIGAIGATTVNVVTASALPSVQSFRIAADSDTTTLDACAGLTEIDSSQDCQNGKGSGVTNIIKAAVTILSIVVGAVSVIMVIIAGFKYVTSSGDSNNISSAKNTLVYALVGLAITAMAQLLVHFVFDQSKDAVTPASPTVTAPAPKKVEKKKAS